VDLLHFLSLLLLLLLGLVLIFWFFLSRFQSVLQKAPDDRSLLLMQQQIDQLRLQFGQVLDNNTQRIQQQLGQMLGHVSERLKENAELVQKTQQSLGERLDNAARVVGHVQKSLGGLEEANRKIYEVGKDIAMQHTFLSGEKVDAVVKLGGSLVPVDSKFPLENFKRILEAATEDDRTRAKKQFVGDVRKHIDAIAGKYILPDEGTYDFALMYIPAENVYYETIIKDESPEEKNLSQYALSKRVIPVSPNSFYAYLQAIVLGLKGMRIEERAQEIVRYLSGLQGDFAKLHEDMSLLGRHLSHAQSSYQSAEKRLEQFGQKLVTADAEQKERFDPRSSGHETA
jgi:DNA recombination protein RmuC